MPQQLTLLDIFTPDVTVPKPHEKVTAASVNVAFQSLGNRTKWLYNQMTKYHRLYKTAQNSWPNLEDSPAFSVGFSTGSYVDSFSADLFLDIPNCHTDDIVDASFHGVMLVSGAGPTGWLRFTGIESVDGVPAGFIFDGCSVKLAAAQNDIPFPLSFRALYQCTRTGKMRITISGRIEAPSTPTIVYIKGPWVISALVYRAEPFETIP